MKSDSAIDSYVINQDGLGTILVVILLHLIMQNCSKAVYAMSHFLVGGAFINNIVPPYVFHNCFYCNVFINKSINQTVTDMV